MTITQNQVCKNHRIQVFVLIRILALYRNMIMTYYRCDGIQIVFCGLIKLVVIPKTPAKKTDPNVKESVLVGKIAIELPRQSSDSR